MWADGDLAFDEGILAGLLISRSVADCEELAAEGDFVAASAVGEKAVVADALKTVRQDMEQDPPIDWQAVRRLMPYPPLRCTLPKCVNKTTFNKALSTHLGRDGVGRFHPSIVRPLPQDCAGPTRHGINSVTAAAKASTVPCSSYS